MVKNRSQILFIILLLCCVMLNGCAVDIKHKHVLCQECGKCISESCDGLEEERCKGHEENHNHIPCPDCGKCIAEDCDGLEEEKCQGHQIVHTHIECEECGKCIAEDCNGLEEEKCQGHQIVHTHIECEECGKCIAEDCNGLEEEKCKECIAFKLIDEKYVSFIFEESHEEMAECIIINTYEEYLNFIITNSIMNVEFGEIDGFVYNDKYFSVLDKYDENYFKHSSLMFFCVGSLHSRTNPRLIYKIDYVEDILIVNMTITFDSYPIDFQGALFYSIEVNKNLIKKYKDIEYKANKIVIYE